jgi:D-sedoheptulose 7-phosphate isomerase
MTFPDTRFTDLSAFMDAYGQQYERAFGRVDRAAVVAACSAIEKAYLNHRTVFVCGNGGSAAIANHMVCDHGKLIGTDTGIRVRVQSLCNSNELLTAISNDITYEDVFAFPLKSMAQPGDVLLTISGSGTSRNIVKAIEAAQGMQLTTIAFTGFDGGKSGGMSDIHVHVPSDNFGVVEDIHQSLMQIVAQFIRMSHMDPQLVADRRF